MLPTPTSIVAYLALFAAVGFLFLLVSLLLGRLLRAAAPSAEKLEPYECGEPSIGSSFVQFDLRFYVVALVFIIFEVEVALFFPPATVFGKATQLMDTADDSPRPLRERDRVRGDLPRGEIIAADSSTALPLTPAPLPQGERGASKAQHLACELGMSTVPVAGNAAAYAADAHTLASMALLDLGSFFAVILVGFAYVWWRGDLDWVRAIGP